MPTYFDAKNNGVLDALLLSIATRATKILLLSGYSQGQNYATVINSVSGEADIEFDDFDDIIDGANNSRVLRFTGIFGNATRDNVFADTHIALTNGVDTVLHVTDELANPVSILESNTLYFAAFNIHSMQPVAP